MSSAFTISENCADGCFTLKIEKACSHLHSTDLVPSVMPKHGFFHHHQVANLLKYLEITIIPTGEKQGILKTLLIAHWLQLKWPFFHLWNSKAKKWARWHWGNNLHLPNLVLQIVAGFLLCLHLRAGAWLPAGGPVPCGWGQPAGRGPGRSLAVLRQKPQRCAALRWTSTLVRRVRNRPLPFRLNLVTTLGN